MFKNKSAQSILSFLGMGAFLLLTAACSQSRFQPTAVRQLLNSSSVFGGSGSDPLPNGTTVGSNGNNGTGQDPSQSLGDGWNPFNVLPGNSNPNSGAGNDPMNNPPPASAPTGVGADPTNFPIQYYCDDFATQQANTNALSASSLTLTVTDPTTGQVVCTITTARNSIVNSKILDFSSCPQMTGNSYNITLTDPQNPGKNLLYTASEADSQSASANPISITKASSSGNWSLVASTSSNRNWFDSSCSDGGAVSTQLYVLYDANNNSDTNCDFRGASPLVIDTAQDAENSRPIDLTSPFSGVLFNILGDNSTPIPNTPKKISWMQNTDYMFLVLPNSQGQVLGINQMFGNNTVGPDGQMASNGFMALAKYDTNHDGVIDAQDPVFSRLRLWSDRDFDGVAQSNELYTLQQIGVESIDLNYDGNYREFDQYGNEVRYKSAVQFKDGLHLIFDLWFTLKAN